MHVMNMMVIGVAANASAVCCRNAGGESRVESGVSGVSGRRKVRADLDVAYRPVAYRLHCLPPFCNTQVSLLAARGRLPAARPRSLGWTAHRRRWRRHVKQWTAAYRPDCTQGEETSILTAMRLQHSAT